MCNTAGIFFNGSNPSQIDIFVTDPPYGGRLELELSKAKPWPGGFPGDPAKRRKNIINDGFSAHLVAKSRFDGIMEIPVIEKPDEIIIPNGMTPFSKAHRVKDFSDFVVFYEHDLLFADVLTSTEEHLPLLSKFAGVVSPDCSLYRDMPLVLQIANTYMNRAVGSFLQGQGLYVVPNVRWGDERSFTTVELPEKIAFLGVEHESIVSIGTHGCCKSKEDKYYLKAASRRCSRNSSRASSSCTARCRPPFSTTTPFARSSSDSRNGPPARGEGAAMGTGKSGRYLSTKGGGRSVSDYAVVHSLEGTFTYENQGNISRMKSGGHGQENMEILSKAGIGYTVTKTYDNGVRIGNVSRHKKPNKREHGGQAWFPNGWTEKDVKRAGSHVASLKKNRKARDGEAVFGMYKGVRVGIIKTHGKIATVFPDVNQPRGRRGKK